MGLLEQPQFVPMATTVPLVQLTSLHSQLSLVITFQSAQLLVLVLLAQEDIVQEPAHQQ